MIPICLRGFFAWEASTWSKHKKVMRSDRGEATIFFGFLAFEACVGSSFHFSPLQDRLGL